MTCNLPPRSTFIVATLKSAKLLLTVPALLLLVQGNIADGEETQANCFTERDSHRLPFLVIQQAPPPPAVVGKAYPHFPLSAVSTMQLGKLGPHKSPYRQYYFQWANRSNAPLYSPAGKILPRKANIQPSRFALRKQRSQFSSIEAADACTLAQTAQVLGLRGQAVRLAQTGGVKVVSERRQKDGPGNGPRDTCVLVADGSPAGLDGIMLDYEAQDGRSGAHSVQFLRQFAELVRSAGKSPVLLINAFDAPSHRYSGISAQNAGTIVRLFDLTTVFLWGRNRQNDIAASYAAQMAMIRAGGPLDPARIIIDYDLAGTTQEDARLVHDLILRDRLAGVMLWRNGAAQGGHCDAPVNRKIASLLFGGK